MFILEHASWLFNGLGVMIHEQNQPLVLDRGWARPAGLYNMMLCAGWTVVSWSMQMPPVDAILQCSAQMYIRKPFLLVEEMQQVVQFLISGCILCLMCCLAAFAAFPLLVALWHPHRLWVLTWGRPALVLVPWLVMAVAALQPALWPTAWSASGRSITTVRKAVQSVSMLVPAVALLFLANPNISPPAAVAATDSSPWGDISRLRLDLLPICSDIAPKQAGQMFGLCNILDVCLAYWVCCLLAGLWRQLRSFVPVFQITAAMYVIAVICWNILCTGERVFWFDEQCSLLMCVLMCVWTSGNVNNGTYLHHTNWIEQSVFWSTNISACFLSVCFLTRWYVTKSSNVGDHTMLNGHTEEQHWECPRRYCALLTRRQAPH